MNPPSHIHLDAVGGIAGDMFVAAMLDAFPHLEERVFADIAAILPAEAGNASLSEGLSGAVRCRRFALVAVEPAHQAENHHHHPHEPHHDHHHTSYRALVARITSLHSAAGSLNACKISVEILTHIAAAEARIHGVPIEDVHFHELADWDSLMDVVAAGSIIAALPDVTWSVSDLPRGSGLVRTQHGLLPVPAPATIEMLEGFSWRDDGIGGERVTPTGAAILRHLITGQGKAEGRLIASGTGAGTRELPGTPNILRVLAFAKSASALDHDQVAVLSFDIDDMTGEEIGIAADRLRALDGVRDLTIAALSGKKGRPMSGFRLLVDPAALEAVKARCLIETSTIGLRWHIEQRDILKRSAGGPGGLVKTVHRPDGSTTAKLESDDLISLEGLQARRAAKRKLEGDVA